MAELESSRAVPLSAHTERTDPSVVLCHQGFGILLRYIEPATGMYEAENYTFIHSVAIANKLETNAMQYMSSDVKSEAT